MPFKVRFNLYEPGKLAPCFVTYDRNLAHVTYNEMLRKGLALSRFVPEVFCEDPTKHERYVFLVYRTMIAIHRYFDNRANLSKAENEANKKMSLALEGELDKWNQQTRAYLTAHPGMEAVRAKDPSFAFFQLVERWRNVWHRYFAYKNQKNKDKSIEKEMRNQCFAYERQIDNYVNNFIGL